MNKNSWQILNSNWFIALILKSSSLPTHLQISSLVLYLCSTNENKGKTYSLFPIPLPCLLIHYPTTLALLHSLQIHQSAHNVIPLSTVHFVKTSIWQVNTQASILGAPHRHAFKASTYKHTPVTAVEFSESPHLLTSYYIAFCDKNRNH